MKKIIALLAIIVLASCAQTVQPAATPEPANVRVYDSAWNIVIEERLASRDITSDDAIEAQVSAYNAAHTDDQWQIIYGADEILPGAAPEAIAYIVDAADHSVYFQTEVERVDLEAHRSEWRTAAEAWSDEMGRLVPAVLYVDNVPPAPVATPSPDPYAIYALYEVQNSTGAIICEDHPAEADYARRLAAFNLDVEGQNYFHPEDPWHVVTGRLYP